MRKTTTPTSKRAVLAAIACLTLAAACDVHTRDAFAMQRDAPPLAASSGSFAVTLESDSGSLPSYTHRGGVFVEGRRGEAYGVRVTNSTPERVEVVVTVDGRDVVSGAPGDFEAQRGYVVEPWGSVRVDGFRRSLDEVAQFRFASPEDSYSSRRGTPENVGVVGVAVFRERLRRAPSNPVPLAVPGPAEARAEAPGADMDKGASRRGRLGTQYGEDRAAPVTETRFERAEPQRPDALLAVYYDSREGLVARGVLPPPVSALPIEPEPEPFPVNGRFAPPPP